MLMEKQLIAIAEACPTLFEIYHTYGGTTKLRAYLMRKDDENLREVDPLNDLNAMNEAEGTLILGSDKLKYAALKGKRCTGSR